MDSASNLPWNDDPQDGMAWHCPDCTHLATLGGNAAYHAVKTGHRPPELRPWTPEPDRGADRLREEGAAFERARLLRLAEELRVEEGAWEATGGGWDGALREFIRRAGDPEPEKPAPKRIRITKALPAAWYAGRLGEVFHVRDTFADRPQTLTEHRPCFLVLGPGGALWAVAESDCEPVPDEGQG